MTHRARVRLLSRLLAACAMTLGMLAAAAPAAVAAAAGTAAPALAAPCEPVAGHADL